MRPTLSSLAALAVIAATGKAASAQMSPDTLFDTEVSVESLGGGQTRFGRCNNAITAGMDFYVWRGQALDANGAWRAALWTWSADDLGPLPIHPLPDAAHGDSGANAIVDQIEGIFEEIFVVGFTTSQQGTRLPCVWIGDEFGPFLQHMLPAPQGGGEVLTIAVPDGNTVLLGGYVVRQGVQYPAIWKLTFNPDGTFAYTPSTLVGPADGGRITHLTPDTAYGFYTEFDGVGAEHEEAYKWTLDDGVWSSASLNLTPPSDFDGSRITGGWGPDVLLGAWTHADGDASEGAMLAVPFGGVVYAQPFVIKGSNCDNCQSGLTFDGLVHDAQSGSALGVVGSLRDATGVRVAGWNVFEDFPRSVVLPIALGGTDSDDRSAVGGVLTPDGTVAIAVTSLTPDGHEHASLLLGSTKPCIADCNGDGTINSLDFYCFLQAYQAGCP